MTMRKVGNRGPLKLASDSQVPQSRRATLSLCSENQKNVRLNTVSLIWEAERMFVRRMSSMRRVGVGERS